MTDRKKDYYNTLIEKGFMVSDKKRKYNNKKCKHVIK